MATNNAINVAIPVPVNKGGTGTTTYTTHGVLYYDGTKVASTAAGTSGYVLKSNGTGSAPGYITFSSGTTGVETFTCGTGSATQSSRVITFAGTANQVTTTGNGTGATVTLAIPSSPSFSGTTTVASGVTITSGDLTLSSGNLALPIWGTSPSKGRITINSLIALAMINDGGSVTRNITMGNAGNTSMVVADNVYIGDSCAAAATSPPQWDVCIGAGVYQSANNFSKNNAIGYRAQYSAGNSDSVTALGYQALKPPTGVSFYNISIGADSSSTYTAGGTERHNLIISNAGTASESHACHIGTSGSSDNQVSSCYIAGINSVTVSGGIAVYQKSDDQLGTSTSSARFKTDITDMGDASAFIHRLMPVSFRYKTDLPTPVLGLIAEEVDRIAPSLVVYDKQGAPFSVRYQDLPALLLNELKKLMQRTEELCQAIKKLEEA